jgi:hypothetical protein
VPSGKITNGSPASTTSMHRRSASRSAVPRLTGKAPRAENTFPIQPIFQRLALPMNRIRRRVTVEATKVSMFERCTGARM